MHHKSECQDCMHTAHLLSESECGRPETGPGLVGENWDLGASHLSLTVKENTCLPPGDLSVLLTWPHAPFPSPDLLCFSAVTDQSHSFGMLS